VKLSLRLACALFLFSAQSFAFEFKLPSVDGFEASVVVLDTNRQFQVEMKGSINPARTPAGRVNFAFGAPDATFSFTIRLGFQRTEIRPSHYPFSTFVQIESDDPDEVVEWIRARGLEISEGQTASIRLEEIEQMFGTNVRYGLEENAARFSQLSPRDTRVFFFLIRNYFQNMSDLFDEKAGVAMLERLFTPATAQMRLPEALGTLWAEKAGQSYKVLCGALADLFSRILASRTVVADSMTDIYEINFPAGARPGPEQLFGSLDLRVEGISFLSLQSNSEQPGLIPAPLAETMAAGLTKYIEELDRLRNDPKPVRGPETMRALAAALNACADAVEKAGKQRF